MTYLRPPFGFRRVPFVGAFARCPSRLRETSETLGDQSYLWPRVHSAEPNTPSSSVSAHKFVTMPGEISQDAFGQTKNGKDVTR